MGTKGWISEARAVITFDNKDTHGQNTTRDWERSSASQTLQRTSCRRQQERSIGESYDRQHDHEQERTVKNPSTEQSAGSVFPSSFDRFSSSTSSSSTSNSPVGEAITGMEQGNW